DRNANALGSAVLVTSGFELIDNLRITANNAGDFIVAWLNPATWTIYAVRFNSLGIAQGVAVPVAPSISNGALSDIAINDSGDFFISWTEGVSPQIVNLRKYSGSNSILWTKTQNTIFSTTQDALGLDGSGNIFLPAKRLNGLLFIADIFKNNTDGQAVGTMAQVISVSSAEPIISGIASFQDDIIALSPNGQTQEIAMQYYNAAGLLVGSQTVANSSPMAIVDSRMSVNDNFQGVLTWTRLNTFDQVIRTFRVNHAPFDMTLSNKTVDENAGIDTFVGLLSVSDIDLNDSSVFKLVNGAGSTNNKLFSIRNDSLFTAEVIDFEATPVLNIRIRAQDTGNETNDSIFVISVNDDPSDGANTPPYNIVLSNSTIEENNAKNSWIGVLWAMDDESPDAINFTLLPTQQYSDNASFYTSSDTIYTSVSFDFETQSQYNIGVAAADIQGLTTG
ncbi:MAG: cadherin repeat domain-containing protein, partial [Cyclobacteriaceae bacterium]